MDMPYGIWVLYILRILSERTCRQLKSATPTGRLTIKSTASEGGVAVQLPAVLQGFGNAAAERGVVRSGEVAVEFHERFLQCEKHFQTASKAGRGRLKQYSEISKKQ